MPVLNAARITELHTLLDEATLAAAFTAVHDKSPTMKRIGRAQLRLIERDMYALWRHREVGEDPDVHECRTCCTPTGARMTWPCTELRIVVDYWLGSRR